MKKWIAVLVLVLSAAAAAVAGGAKEDPITGTWIGGSSFPDSQGYKYVYVFTPMGPGQWRLIAQSAYGPASWGAGMATFWAGDIRKVGTRYELRLICLTQNDLNEPPMELPGIIAARAWLTVTGPDEIKLVYDTAGNWTWGTNPFVDAAAAWAYTPDSGVAVEEILHRFETVRPINLP